MHCTIDNTAHSRSLNSLEHMHNLDDTHPIRPVFETSTCEFRATTGANEPSGPANIILPVLFFMRNNSSIVGSSSSHYYLTNLNSLCHGICVHQENMSAAVGLEPGTPGSESTTLPMSYPGIFIPLS